MQPNSAFISLIQIYRFWIVKHGNETKIFKKLHGPKSPFLGLFSGWVYLIWIQSISYQSFLEPKPYQWVLIQNTKQNLRKLFTGPLVRFQDHLNKFKSCWSQIVLPEFLLHCWLDKRHLIDSRFLWQSRKHK